MSLLRSELIEKRLDGPDVFDHLVEEEDDFLTDPVLTTKSGEGSMAYCEELDAPCLLDSDGWKKKTDSGWQLIQAESEE